MSRPDQSITFLKRFGYSVFRVPRISAQPLELLHRNGKDLTRLGSVTDLITAGAVLPPPVRRDDQPGVDIEGTESSQVNVTIGVNILASFIGALGGGNLGVQTGFSRAKSVTFKYAGVKEDSIDVLRLEQFIRAGRINQHVPSGTIDKLIDDEVYAITSVLKTSKIVVAAQGEAGANVAVDVPVIQQAVGGNVKIASEGAIGSNVTFEGALAIPFAFQAVQLVFDESGEFLTTEQLAAGDAAARALGREATAAPGRVFLGTAGAFVRMGERVTQELSAGGQAAIAGRDASPVGASARRGFGAVNAGGSPASTASPGAPAVSAVRPGKRTALCVGIDAYPAPNTLTGCVNDSRDWEALFQSMQCAVSTLRNEEATRAAITDALARHVSQLQPGDLFLFQYAGHGTQFPDDTGDEPDNSDEAFCPVDMMTSGFLRDDEVRAILNRVPQGALAVAFIDCCHSGSITRMIRRLGEENTNVSRARAIPATAEMIEVHRRTRKGGRAVAPPSRNDVLFAACRDDQVAFETGGHGDYTARVVPIIRQGGSGLTNLAVQKLIQAEFGAGARQNPMLDCDVLAESRPFLQP
jgi:hypothetical protein